MVEITIAALLRSSCTPKDEVPVMVITATKKVDRKDKIA
jgi:hypothetical protein